MKKQNRSEPTELSLIIVSSLVTLNVLGTLFVGVLLYITIEISDPIFSESFSLEAYYRQNDIDQLTIGVLILTFIIVFIISLILWIKGKCFWDFILSGLALLHLVGFNCMYYLIVRVDDFQPLILIPSLVLDLAILVVVFLDRKHSKTLAIIETA